MIRCCSSFVESRSFVCIHPRLYSGDRDAFVRAHCVLVVDPTAGSGLPNRGSASPTRVEYRLIHGWHEQCFPFLAKPCWIILGPFGRRSRANIRDHTVLLLFADGHMEATIDPKTVKGLTEE